MSSAICFNLDPSKILSSGYRLSKHQKLVLVQIWESEIRYMMGSMENILKKRKNHLLPGFSPFPIVFSKASFLNPLPDDKNFRLVQIETNCRQFQAHLKWKISTK